MKTSLCLASYWFLFVIIPVSVVLCFVPLSCRLVIAIVLLLILLALGERGYRKWKKLWDIG